MTVMAELAGVILAGAIVEEYEIVQMVGATLVAPQAGINYIFYTHMTFILVMLAGLVSLILVMAA
jgi:hypothetical protein